MRKPAPLPRNLPMFFKGRQQSEEFARGAWAARDAMAKIRAHDGDKWTSEEMTAAHAHEFNHAQKGGDYTRGLVTAMVEFLAFEHCVGAPNMDAWRPLEMDLRHTARKSHPTSGSKLYELDGAAVSVAPDLTVHVWCGSDDALIERDAAFLARLQEHGSLVSQRAFDKLRRKPAPSVQSRRANSPRGA